MNWVNSTSIQSAGDIADLCEHQLRYHKLLRTFGGGSWHSPGKMLIKAVGWCNVTSY